MRIDKPKRGRKGSKRLDLTDIREVLRDRRQWCAVGLVVATQDGSPHWRVEMDGSDAVDILVDLVLQPEQIPLTCRLASGMFIVPDIGEECAVVIPSGRIDFMPLIVALLSSNAVANPIDGQGPTPTQIVIARGKVLIHDGSGGANALALKSDIDNAKTIFDAHVHNVATTGTATAQTGVASPTVTPFPAAIGTTVLEAK